MTAANRNARKKRQQQTAAAKRAVASARAVGPDRTKLIVGIVVVVLLAGAIIGGVIYTNVKKNETQGQTIPPVTTSASAAPTYPVHRDGVTVVAGKDDAKVTIDLYEDFLCPICRAFEQANSGQIVAKIADGSLRVRYHLVAILNERSDPPGYSLDAANAALCVADAGKFPAYHDSLYHAQPQEGARGYDKAQLTKLGTDLGISTPDLKSCIDSSRYNSDLLSAQNQILNTPYLQQDIQGTKSFGTPTVATGQRIIDTSDPQWLTTLLAAAS